MRPPALINLEVLAFYYLFSVLPELLSFIVRIILSTYFYIYLHLFMRIVFYVRRTAPIHRVNSSFDSFIC